MIKVATLLALLFAVLCSCSSSAPVANHGDQALFDSAPDARLALTMRDIRYEPQSLEFSRGTLVAIDIANAADVLHDFSIERLDVSFAYRLESEPSRVQASKRAVHIALRPGGSAEVRLKFDQAGEFLFFCDQPGHRRAGMTGMLTVR
jgi:uncharacterized cupredoxin-like copper-binding protein